jgi:hypothetical protein
VIGLVLGCAPVPDAAADACAGCHAEVHGAWADSAHGQGRSDVFEALLPEVRRAWGPAAAERCVGCHEPGFVAGEGVGCVACHAAVGNRGEADGALVVDPRAPLSGRAPDAPHDLAARPFLTSSALCATCHEVTGPGLLVETTGSEHAAWGGDESCADCHLDGHALAVESLLPDALALSIAAEDGAVVVTLRNVGAGHAVPTGAAWLRDLWVDLSFAPRVLEVGPRPVRGGAPVASITDADGLVGEALAPGAAVTARVPVPAGIDPATVEATAWFGRLRPAVADALGVPAPPPIAVARVRVR